MKLKEVLILINRKQKNVRICFWEFKKKIPDKK